MKKEQHDCTNEIQNLYSNKIEITEDIDKFVETYAPPKLSQEDIHNVNKSISSNEIEDIIKSVPSKKSTGPDGFSAKFYKTYTAGVSEIPASA